MVRLGLPVLSPRQAYHGQVMVCVMDAMRERESIIMMHRHHHHDDEQLECQLILPIEINKYQLIRPTQLECQLIFINVNLYLLMPIEIY